MGEVLPEDNPDRISGNPLYEPTPWPNEDCPDLPYRQLMISHYYAMINAGIEFLQLTALGLRLDEHVFVNHFVPKSQICVDSANYSTYKAKGVAPEQGSGQDFTFTCEEHTDTGFLTLLITFTYPELEILRED